MFDQGLTLYLVAGLACLAFGGVAWAVLGDDGAAKSRDRRRRVGGDGALAAGGGGWSLADIFSTKEPTAADRLRELQDEAKRLKNASMRLRLEQAGSTLSPAQFVMRFQFAAILVLAAAVVLEQPLLPAGGVAMFIALFGPGIVLRNRVTKRTQKFLQHFPSAIDVMVRGVRSGMPVSESLKVISEEIEEPVGTEMRRVVSATTLGMSLEDALEQMATRVPSPDVNFFRTVLAIQKQTGGNLAEALSNLSEVLRERIKLKKKVRALSSEARMSAIIIGSLPFLVGLLIYVLQPEYLDLLFYDFRGHVMIGIGLFWMSIGALMMRSMIKFEI